MNLANIEKICSALQANLYCLVRLKHNSIQLHSCLDLVS